MTYYEELGVTPRATTEEIRDAFKQLARLLHPDRLQDERQRSLAECQMKRLNHVYHTLANAEQRRAYDLSLSERPAPVPEVIYVAPADVRPGRNRLLFGPASIVSAGLAGGLLTFLVTGSDTPGRSAPVATPTSHAAPVRQSGAAAPTASAGSGLDALIANLRTRLSQAEKERDLALAKLAVQERLNQPVEHANTGASAADASARPVAPSVIEPVKMPAEAPTPAASVTASASPAPTAVTPAKRNLTGRWYYVRHENGPVRQDLYPPEFIEAAIVEENGLIRGRYRARYKVVDRAIAPEVVFQFAGQVGQSSTWVGPGGAKGEVKIRMVSPDTIEFAWIATELGRYQGLGNGTARLVRREEP